MRNNTNNNTKSGGIGFVGLLTIVFIALKLMNIIAWSWLWVLSPIWISAILIIVILIPVFIYLAVKPNRKKY